MKNFKCCYYYDYFCYFYAMSSNDSWGDDDDCHCDYFEECVEYYSDLIYEYYYLDSCCLSLNYIINRAEHYHLLNYPKE